MIIYKTREGNILSAEVYVMNGELDRAVSWLQQQTSGVDLVVYTSRGIVKEYRNREGTVGKPHEKTIASSELEKIAADRLFRIDCAEYRSVPPRR